MVQPTHRPIAIASAAGSSGMIPYIERDGDPTSPPDYSFPGITVHSFLLPAGLAS
jgi:hypothetical protein